MRPLFWTPEKRNTEGKVDVQQEGTSANKQEQTITKKLATWKINANEIHANLFHTGEYRMRNTSKNLK